MPHKSLQKKLKDIDHYGDRIMNASFNGQGFQLNCINIYAPTSEASTQDKKYFYESLTEAYNKVRYRGPTIILGDFNVRILKPDEEDSTTIGKHLLNNTQGGPEQLPSKQQESRTIFIQKCEHNEWVIPQSFMQKQKHQQITYRSIGTQAFAPPWDKPNYAQLDYTLIPQRWRNLIRDVNARTDTAIDSDHALCIADVHIKLKTIPKDPILDDPPKNIGNRHKSKEMS